MASSQEDLLPPPTEVDDTHKVYSIAIWCIVLGVVTSLFVLLRIGLRIKARAFGADDYAIVPALLLYIGWTAMAAYVNLHAGVGKPLWEITLDEYSVWIKGIIGSAWLYPAMTVSIRISILLFYHRIFATNLVRVKYGIWFLLALQAVYLVVYSILPAFICQPLYRAWDVLQRPLYFDDWYYYYTQVALYSTSMAFDAILLVFPLYPVFKLQMPAKKRAGVALLFMLGAAASIAAAYKLAIFVIEMERYSNIDQRWLRYEMSRLVPPQFDTYGTTFWIPSQVEPTVALIGTSLPAIRHSFVSAAQQVSKIWTSHAASSALSSSRSKQGSGMVDSAVHSSAQKSWYRNAPDSKGLRGSNESEVALHGGYYELNDRARNYA